jgi:hypothetical protein
MLIALAGRFAGFGWSADRPVARGLARQSALLGLCAVLALRAGGFWLTSAAPAHATAALAHLVAP